MSDTAEYLLIERSGLEVYAEVIYSVEEASGDGRNEPYVPTHLWCRPVKLFKRVRRWTTDYNNPVAAYTAVWDVTDLGDPPAWVDAVIQADEDWQNEILENECSYGPCPDRAYDEARDLELTER